MELFAEISKFLSHKNHLNQSGHFWKFQTAVGTEPKMSVIINVTLKPEPREESLDLDSENHFDIGYYCLYIILFGPSSI